MGGAVDYTKKVIGGGSGTDSNVIGAIVDIPNKSFTLKLDEGEADVIVNLNDIFLQYVEKEVGKGLSQEDFTTLLLNKLNSLQVQVQSDWNDSNSSNKSFILNKPAVPNNTTILNQFSVDGSGNLLFNGNLVGSGGASVPLADETTQGIVERATDVEANAKVDTTRYITPKHLGDFNAIINTALDDLHTTITTETTTAIDDLHTTITTETTTAIDNITTNTTVPISITDPNELIDVSAPTGTVVTLVTDTTTPTDDDNILGDQYEIDDTGNWFLKDKYRGYTCVLRLLCPVRNTNMSITYSGTDVFYSLNGGIELGNAVSLVDTATNTQGTISIPPFMSVTSVVIWGNLSTFRYDTSLDNGANNATHLRIYKEELTSMERLCGLNPNFISATSLTRFKGTVLRSYDRAFADTDIVTLDIDTSNATTLYRAFNNMQSLTTISQIDLKATSSIGSIFLDSSAITKLSFKTRNFDIAHFSAFSGCTSLTCIDNIDTRLSSNTFNIFNNTPLLTSPDLATQTLLVNGDVFSGTCSANCLPSTQVFTDMYYISELAGAKPESTGNLWAITTGGLGRVITTANSLPYQDAGMCLSIFTSFFWRFKDSNINIYIAFPDSIINTPNATIANGGYIYLVDGTIINDLNIPIHIVRTASGSVCDADSLDKRYTVVSEKIVERHILNNGDSLDISNLPVNNYDYHILLYNKDIEANGVTYWNPYGVSNPTSYYAYCYINMCPPVVLVTTVDYGTLPFRGDVDYMVFYLEYTTPTYTVSDRVYKIHSDLVHYNNLVFEVGTAISSSASGTVVTTINIFLDGQNYIITYNEASGVVDISNNVPTIFEDQYIDYVAKGGDNSHNQCLHGTTIFENATNTKVGLLSQANIDGTSVDNVNNPPRKFIILPVGNATTVSLTYSYSIN